MSIEALAQILIKNARGVTAEMRQHPIIRRAFAILEKRLPSDLYYHTVEHTEDVLFETVLFAMVDELDSTATNLLGIAAAFHDAGYVERRSDNEEIGARLAREAMTELSFKGGEKLEAEQIELVETMILDTQLIVSPAGMRQRPSHDLSCYLLDGDLSNFGRDDFFLRGELQRREIGAERERFLRSTLDLLNNHQWLTHAARALRQSKKDENLRKLKELLLNMSNAPTAPSLGSLSPERLEIIAQLPLLLNSSLEVRRVVKIAIEHLKQTLQAEAATVFLLEESRAELTFWALQGGEGDSLEGAKMPSNRGIVGWVIDHKQTAWVPDVTKDSRFFVQIDRESGFKTREMICVPLLVRGDEIIGALQVLNRQGGAGFNANDVLFTERFALQVAVAIENARLHERLRERNKTLETLDRRKNEMIMILNHEFKTPLNVIQTSAELISSGAVNDPETLHKMAQTLKKGVVRLTKIAESVKRSRATEEIRSIPLHKERVDVGVLMENVVDSFQSIADERRLQLSVQKPAQPLLVMGDSGLLLVALNNLVSNAIRFTPDNGRITLSAAVRTGMIRISVVDTGIGIDKEQIPLIFKKFYEVKSALQHSSGEHQFGSCGLGLGLSSVQAIVEAHGSSVEVESTPGKGSSFTFNLPVAA